MPADTVRLSSTAARTAYLENQKTIAEASKVFESLVTKPGVRRHSLRTIRRAEGVSLADAVAAAVASDPSAPADQGERLTALGNTQDDMTRASDAIRAERAAKDPAFDPAQLKPYQFRPWQYLKPGEGDPTLWAMVKTRLPNTPKGV